MSDRNSLFQSPTANEGALLFELTHDQSHYYAWFRAKVQEALEDLQPARPDDEVKTHFAKRRAAALRKTKKQGR